ncbi:MAG TPA: DeoR/GlpR family DNA-binding transcription regulator [Lachnospiraceae bacterium]|nr:DeoR/GlpR family DNA-binding transcription regulator [Lachnospiraceae bacterium]
MLSYERQNQILELLNENQSVTVNYLCRKLFASGATIRRDLSEMEGKGLLTRVRGGAALIKGNNQDAPLFIRSQKNIDKKRIIAKLALSYINDYDTIFMDSSSTITVLAGELTLEDYQKLTIVTNGIATSNVLNDSAHVKLILCGGYVNNHSSTVGQLAIDAFSNYRADKLFFSCCGFSVNAGITEASEDNAMVKRQMLKNAKQHILLCDSTKLGLEYFCKSCDFSDLDVIITDELPSEEVMKRLPSTVQLIYPK